MADISTDARRHGATVSSAPSDGMVSENAQRHYDCGMAWARTGAYEQALEEWRQALRIAPNWADAYAAIGSAYMALGCWQEAVGSYQKAITADPYLLESYYGLGSAYGRLGDFNRTIETYEQAFQLLAHDRSSDIDSDPLAAPSAGALRQGTDPFQDRLRADAQGFDFSALLSSPAARRQAVRQEQAT